MTERRTLGGSIQILGRKLVHFTQWLFPGVVWWHRLQGGEFQSLAHSPLSEFWAVTRHAHWGFEKIVLHHIPLWPHGVEL